MSSARKTSVRDGTMDVTRLPYSTIRVFLAVTISLASIALAGVLVQPGQESTRYLPGVQTVYPYESNQVNARLSEPLYLTPHLQYFTSPLAYAIQAYLRYRLSQQQSEQASTTEENEDSKEARRRMERYERKINFIRHMDGGRSLQPLEITNMNMINTAEPSQDKTLQIPFYSGMTPKAYQYADTPATPTSVQSQPPFVTYMQNPYRSNEELLATNEIVGAPYDTNDRPCPNYNFNDLYNYPYDWSNDWDNAGEMEDFFIQLKKKNDTTVNQPGIADVVVNIPPIYWIG